MRQLLRGHVLLRKLGSMHAGYGVLDAHDETVGVTLVMTLLQGLGEAFTPAVEAAWREFYAIVSDVR